MTFNKILTFSLLAVFSSCSGQEKTITPPAANTPKPAPEVIKNFKSAAVAPDFDTTHVSQYIRSIFQDSKGSLWFGTIGEGVVRYDGQTLTYFSSPEGFYNQTVYAINEDKNGNMWFGTDQGVYQYDGLIFKNYNKKDGLNHIDITRKGILVDRSGNVWVGTHGGVYRYDPVADKKGDPCFSLFQELPALNVSGIMEDRSGNIWITSSDKGVFCYNPSASLSAGEKTITHISEKEGLGDNYAGGLAQDKDGNMWFLMKNGICKYDPSASLRTGTSASLSTGASASGRAGDNAFTEITAKDGLGGTEFWGICIEKSGIIWVTARGSTTRYDPSVPLPDPKAFTVFTPAVGGLNCCVQSMYQDRQGNMWWGTGQGLYRFNGKDFYQVKQAGPW